MPTGLFHPLIAEWFAGRFRAPTEPQRLGWPEIAAGRNTLIAAPTGSGKTLAAFLACIDRLLREGVADRLDDAIQVVYISPLKALSNDVRRNLEMPLAEIRQLARDAGHAMPPLRTMVRTGDTPASERQAMLRRPPHILVTTPESLYLLLTGAKSREMLRGVRTVIVDEIHALARDKRGSHLALSLERLAALCDQAPVRIGLSATQRPIDEVARFLVGSNAVDTDGQPDCAIIDVGHLREIDLAIEVPPSPLEAVCSNEQWGEIYSRLAELMAAHRSTLVFVNTRRLAERVTHHLSETLGEDAVTSHHGSLSRERRLAAEERLKSGQLRAIVATASLELGIDVGFIDLVCQIGSPRSIATMLQRVGRSGHSLGMVPCGRLFPLTRDDLLEAMAVVRAARDGRLDQLEMPNAPLDILAQQMVAAAACDDWQEDELYALVRRAWPFRDLSRADFEAVVAMLSEGTGERRRRGAYLHRDRINGRLRARRGARIAAITSGGAIPDTADYHVFTEDNRTFVGTVNEDFAIESMAGDVFLLGNTSWQIRQVRSGEVIVRDADGAPATIPFWLGEAPGRTHELSIEVSALRDELAARITVPEPAAHTAADGNGASTNGDAAVAADEATIAWLTAECGVDRFAAGQVMTYVAAQKAALGLVPTAGRIVFERFFDESGGMQLVIHSPLGARINRAWGLALRKRFCRSFNFELQAAANDNGIVLSLGPQHSFAIDEMFRMLSVANGAHLLKQALLAVPMFQVRWRWNATRALAVLRQHGGQKVPPPLQRFRADDLLTSVFPTATACLENVTGDIDIPDHPLVRQTVHDCLHEAMDLNRWMALLADIQRGEVELVARDTREPSPFSYEILNANPYAFLDDAPLEERRARAVATRRMLGVDDVRELARLDPDAIAQVADEAWPVVRDADELHDALLSMGALPAGDGAAWREWFDELVAAGRAATAAVSPGVTLWLAAECQPSVEAAYPEATFAPRVVLPDELAAAPSSAEAVVSLARGYIEVRGPVTAAAIADALALRPAAVRTALEALEGQGVVLRGHFMPAENAAGDSTVCDAAVDVQWCERRLLARIHRLTLEGARRQIRPVEPHVFVRFLLEHQHVSHDTQLTGRKGLRDVVAQLEGFEIASGAWEDDVLPARLGGYDPAWLDDLSLYGEIAWGRLQPPRKDEANGRTGSALTRSVPISLVLRDDLPWLLPAERSDAEPYARSAAGQVLDALDARGASFITDLLTSTGLLPAQVESALAELAALGLVTADGFASIRPLVSPDRRRPGDARRRRARRRRHTERSAWRGGRWSRFPGALGDVSHTQRVERWVRLLLRRWGVVFRDLVARDNLAPRWRELVGVYRRMEARGEVRGGRFVSGVAGEQYAEPAAVDHLRRVRDAEPDDRCTVISAADPLNLAGIIGAGDRIPAKRSNTIALRDGRLIAARVGGETRLFADVRPDAAERLARALRVNGVVRAADAARDREMTTAGADRVLD